MAGGRPSDFTQQMADLICGRISGGETLRAVCRDDGMPNKSTVLRWLRNFPEFRVQYTQAREDLLEHWAEQIVDISDDNEKDTIVITNEDGSSQVKVDHDHINRSRLRVDTRKWLLSKLGAKKYGDKLNVEAEITVSLSDRMRELLGKSE